MLLVLRGIDPLLSGDVLKLLDDMGHGDRLLVVDRNYPAAAAGRPVLRMGESGAERVLAAVLSVLPLDAFVEHPLERMEIKDDPTLTSGVQDRVLELARRDHPRPLEYGVIPRFEFYRRARDAFAILQCLEPEPYSCFVLQKGVVYPEGLAADGT